MFQCEHCSAEVTLDDVPIHQCFIEKDVYMKENNILFATTTKQSSDSCDMNKKQSKDECILPEISPGSSEPVNTKQQAVWDKRATLALLALYEANIENIDHPKKKTKIWSTISMGLLEHGIEVTDQQVRWKMNALMKRYKEVIDNNMKSGRGTIEFEWFQVMDDFLGKKGNVTAAGYTVSSKVGLEKVEPSTSQPVKKFNLESRKMSKQSAMNNLATIESFSNSHNTEKKKTLTTHGTGSNIAKTKIELEKQWLKHLQLKEEYDKNKQEKNKDLIESKKEALKLKKKHLAMKEKEMEQRSDIATNKMSEKRKRHADIIEIERLKYKLLKKFIEKKENRSIDVSEESD